MVSQSPRRSRSAEASAKAAVHVPCRACPSRLSRVVGDRRPDLLVEQPPPFVGPLVEQRQVHHRIRQRAGISPVIASPVQRLYAPIVRIALSAMCHWRAAWARSAARSA
jgi:hypothetical protein